MKDKTVMIVGAVAVLGIGFYLYRKQKANAAVTAATSAIPEMQTAVSHIHMPVSSDQKIINLPPTLLEPSGNTGIMSPAITAVTTPAPVIAPAVPVSVIASQPSKTPAVTAKVSVIASGGGASMPAQKQTAFKGLGNAYALN